MNQTTSNRLPSIIWGALCPRCGCRCTSTAARTLQVEMRPILTEEVPLFPDALAEVEIVDCTTCGYRMCLDYRIALDDNPELDLNEE